MALISVKSFCDSDKKVTVLEVLLEVVSLSLKKIVNGNFNPPNVIRRVPALVCNDDVYVL